MTFLWSIAGSINAKGAHRTEPSKPKNLSVFSARDIASTIAEIKTIIREVFLYHVRLQLFYFMPLNIQVSKMVLQGKIKMG